MTHNFRDLRNFLSDWSDRKINLNKVQLATEKSKFDDIFQIDEIPISWFVRPILYSSLLPLPFSTVDGFVNQQKTNKMKQKIYREVFGRGLLAAEYSRYILRQKFLSKSSMNKSTILLPSSRNETTNLSKIFMNGSTNLSNSKNETAILSNDPKNEAIGAASGKILFFSFSNYCKDNGLSFREEAIISKIKTDNKYEALSLFADPLTSFAAKKLLKIESMLYDYYDSDLISSAKDGARKLAELWTHLPEEVLRSQLFYQNKDLYDYFKENLNQLYSYQFLTLINLYYLTFKKILRDENIKAAVVTSQNNIFEKCLIAAAGKVKVPVIVIQHGIALGMLPTIDTPHHVKFAVFGERYQQMLVDLGVLRENIAIVGPIILDGIEQYVDRARIGDVPADVKNTKIFFATSPMIEDRFIEQKAYFTRVKKILSDFRTIKPAKLVIKLHPREKLVKEYHKILNELALKAEMVTTIDRSTHYKLIQDSDLVVSFGSTVALEAMIIGRPSLSIDIFDKNNPTNKVVIDSGATTFVKYTENLTEIALKLLQKDEKSELAKKFVKQLCFQLDGKASERIVELIYSCAEDHDLI